MLIPLRCDAPLPHRPWGTAAVMAATLAAYLMQVHADAATVRGWWILPYGHGYTPLRWLTSAFAHAGLMHLVGNLVFLWTFGLIIEGKLGWWRFVALYLAFAASTAFIEQTLAWRASGGGSLGASSVITALMAMAWLWAPRNVMDVVLWVAIRPYTLELPVWGACALFIAFDVVEALVGSLRMTTPVLHLIGAGSGAAVGWLMLRRGWVDCEGWDAITIWRHGRPQPRRIAAPAPIDVDARRAQALSLARDAVAEGADDAAWAALDAAERETGAWPLPEDLLLTLTDALAHHERWAEAERRLAAARRVEDRDVLRLRHAALLAGPLARPTAALAVLATIAQRPTDDRFRAELERVRLLADQRRAEGTLELLD